LASFSIIPRNAAAFLHRALHFHFSHHVLHSQRVTATVSLLILTMTPGKASFKMASLTAGETRLFLSQRARAPAAVALLSF
jgi:hypothetical protein